ncbi:hypothetical protein ACLBXM_15330 [Xanthobacteraceae bacterium A53D]
MPHAAKPRPNRTPPRTEASPRSEPRSHPAAVPEPPVPDRRPKPNTRDSGIGDAPSPVGENDLA